MSSALRQTELGFAKLEVHGRGRSARQMVLAGSVVAEARRDTELDFTGFGGRGGGVRVCCQFSSNIAASSFSGWCVQRGLIRKAKLRLADSSCARLKSGVLFCVIGSLRARAAEASTW